MTDEVRTGLLLRTFLQVLRDAGRPVPEDAARTGVTQRVDLTDEERRVHASGDPAWLAALRPARDDSATIGWLVERDGSWAITDEGSAALDAFPAPDQFLKEVGSQYHEMFRRRSRVDKKYAPAHDTLAGALAAVHRGEWTSHDDLAQLVGGDPAELRDLAAAGALPNAHRVLLPDGRIPPVRFQPPSHREGDLRALLVAEGVEFQDGRASVGQRLTADALRERTAEAAGRRAWLVRGSNVDGVDLVPPWLAGGWVSLAGSQFPPAELGADRQRLREVVATAYRHKSYSVREKLTGEFDAFLRQMGEGDYLVTMRRGEAYLGIVEGGVTFSDSPDRRSQLRRPVRWLNADGSIDLTELPAPLPTLIQSQDDVVDLTDALAVLDRLYDELTSELAPPPVSSPPAEARLNKVTPGLAATLLIDDIDWLREVRDLLADRRQLIFYGPPGTGKTYVAQKLAAALTEPYAVKLVQFHPSYTYEDFFEGFRPESSEDGTLRFRLTSGPLRKLADEAREHPSTAYLLIIDEINRGNLAKIFGELYFLLEYRDQRISLQYSQGDFTLPPNLYVIGTMNTADRSIALVDAAMRRRFAFVEMHPSKPPVAGLLRRWLAREGVTSEAADLFDALNARLADADYAIGPSYFMRPSIYQRPDGLDRVWLHDLLPLLVEHHYADDIDVHERYGLAAVRADLA